MTPQRTAETRSRRSSDCTLSDSAARVLSHAPDAVLVIDGMGVVTFANAAAEVLLDRPGDALVGRCLAEWLPDGEAARELQGALAAGREIRDQSLELRLGGDRWRRVSLAASRSPFGSNGRSGSVLYLRGLDERLRTERDLELRNQELEHCVHTLSHDLRSPLVALLGFSRLLRQDYESRLDETGRHFLDRIEQAGRTMEDLIHNLLELSRIERPGAREWVDPRSVLLQLQAELKPRLDAAGIRLELPESPPLVCCDRTRLYQVFSNLIGNAIDHMGSCDDPRVTIEVHDQGREHCLSVSDPGRGIPPEHHERIFQVFQSLGQRRDGRRGTGIGLAIVRRIAETHGGRAWVESQPGAGARFLVTLPKE